MEGFHWSIDSRSADRPTLQPSDRPTLPLMTPSRLIAWFLPEDSLDRRQFATLASWIAATGGAIIAAGLLESYRRGWLSGLGLVVSLAAAPVVLLIIARVVWSLVAYGSRALVGTVLAGGGIAGPESTSLEDALVQRGQIEEAIMSYEGRIKQAPRSVTLRLRLSDLYRQRADYANAVRVLQEARVAAPRGEHENAVANALIDLYERMGERGPLMTEYARFAAAHRGTKAGDAARRRLAQLKMEGDATPRG